MRHRGSEPTYFRALHWDFTRCAILHVRPRSAMLDSLSQEYIKTARAKGLKNKKIIFKHALRNALIPVITYLGPQVAFTLCGGFVVESVFSIPGLGRYFIQAIQNRDYPLIMGTTIFLASFIVIMNLIVDLCYKLVDPRINLAKGGIKHVWKEKISKARLSSTKY